MRYRFEFTIEEHELEKMVKRIIGLSAKTKIEKSKFDFEKLNPTNRAAYLLIFATIGLLESGYSEEKTTKILKTLFDISVENLSPGNNEIH